MDSIGFMTAIELTELIGTKQISPIEYTQALLDRIAVVGPKLNIFAYSRPGKH